MRVYKAGKWKAEAHKEIEGEARTSTGRVALSTREEEPAVINEPI